MTNTKATLWCIGLVGNGGFLAKGITSLVSSAICRTLVLLSPMPSLQIGLALPEGIELFVDRTNLRPNLWTADWVAGSQRSVWRGDKVTPQEALRAYLAWEFDQHEFPDMYRVAREALDTRELRKLLDFVVPKEEREEPADDDSSEDGEGWKTASE